MTTLHARTSGGRSWRRIISVVLTVCFSAVTTLVPVNTANAWGFSWWAAVVYPPIVLLPQPIGQIPTHPRQLPTDDELIDAALLAYQIYYLTSITGLTLFIPTLMAALLEGKGVSLEQRKQICLETGGTFTSSLKVSPCQSNIADLFPASDSGLDTQPQTCDRGSGHTYDNVCIYTDNAGRYYWDDGPSIPPVANDVLPGHLSNNYLLLFWPVGQWHDYCYHHGQITYGFDKEKCDSHFYTWLRDICSEELEASDIGSWFSTPQCIQAAQLAREAVKRFGDAAFRYTSTFVDFEGRFVSPGYFPAIFMSVNTAFND